MNERQLKEKGAGTTAVLMPKRLCLVVSSRSVRRQPEKLGRRWWKVWNKVLPGNQCRQSGVLVDQVCQQHEWVVPSIAARYREELCSSVLQSYTVCAPGPAATEGWRVRVCDVVGRFRLKRLSWRSRWIILCTLEQRKAVSRWSVPFWLVLLTGHTTPQCCRRYAPKRSLLLPGFRTCRLSSADCRCFYCF